MGKRILLNEGQFGLLLEALAIEPYINDIRAMAEKCVEMANEFKNVVESSGLDEMMFSELPEEVGDWQYDGDLEDETIFSYSKYAGEIGDTGVYVVLIYRPEEYRNQASFNAGGENGEIWLVVKGNDDVNKVYYSLAHEMIHALDYQRGLCGFGYNSAWMRDDEKLPECIEWIFYYLWNTSEFNAHQVDALKKANPKDVYAYWKRTFDKLIGEASELTDDNEIWVYIWKTYISKNENSNVTPKQARDYFMKKTWYLVDKFLRAIAKKSYKFNGEN